MNYSIDWDGPGERDHDIDYDDYVDIHTPLQPPEYKWQYCFGGDWTILFLAHKGPHLLGRTLQKWLLGIHWRKVE